MLRKERKSNRWEKFDYTNDRYYFVTICVKNREMFFGEIIDKQMVLNEYGLIIKQQLWWLENNFVYIKLNEFVIMPNHTHVIIEIDKYNGNHGVKIIPVGTGLDLSLQTQIKILPLSNIVGAFKTTSSKLYFI